MRLLDLFCCAGGRSQRDQLDHYGVDARRQVMQIDWMTQGELSEAIPPAYTQFLGRQLMAYLQRKAVRYA